jgi:chemotaxis protein MotB
MRKVSWLVAGISLILSLALMSCGYIKKDEFDKQLSDHKMDVDQKVQLAQDAAVEASDKADKNLELAKQEIAKAKEEAIAAASEKDMETLAAAKASSEEGDNAVRQAAEKAAAKALSDAKAVAMAEDEKVKQAAKQASDKALSAAEEADRKAAMAAKEAELAKELPESKEPKKFVVFFNLGQTKWKKENDVELEKAADLIKSNPNAWVRIEGHTDNTPVIKSGHLNNWGLSQARANSVKDHLVKKLGVPAEAIKESIGIAFYKPMGAKNSTNRRTEVYVYED